MAANYIAHPTVLTLSFPSFTILALDSQIVCRFFGRVSSEYDKLIQLRPCVFLACFGDCDLIDQIRAALLADPPQNPRFVGDLAVFVQNTINTVLGNARDRGDGDGDGDGEFDLELVLIGRCDLDCRCYVFNFSKGQNTWMYFAKRNVERVATATNGSNGTTSIPTVTTFLEEHVLDDENIKEKNAVKYAFNCMKYAEFFSFDSGGRIQVVVVKPGCSIVHAWEKDDPSKFLSKYIYRGHRISQGY